MSYQLFYGLSEMMNFDTHQTSNHQNATPSQPDPRVAAALDEIGFAYEVDALEASYFINLPIGDGRSHGVNIGSKTRQFMGAEMRRICSISFESDGPFDRLLICQALSHGLTLITDDILILKYDVPTL